MEIVYARHPLPDSFSRSLFLAGPTPRHPGVASWRPEALAILKRLGFDGAVLVPEDPEGGMGGDYAEQVEWEWRGLDLADCVVFWIPRDLANLPGFTTNVEFGLRFGRSQIVLGSPHGAPKMGYLRHVADRHGIPTFDNLEDTLARAVHLTAPSPRQGGERYVPLEIWRTPSFQSWHRAQIDAGNRLDDARVEWVFRPRRRPDTVFFWILRVRVWVKAEGRHKSSEVVLGRADLASTLLYLPMADPRQTRLVLVREFRSPVNNPAGMVMELPGGSSFDTDNFLEVAVGEVREETGFRLDANRLRFHQTRQVAATVSSHRAWLYSARLTPQEMAWFEERQGQLGGEADESERTYIDVRSFEELLSCPEGDWATMGMVAQVICTD